ncbi:hypothetical protein D9M71_499540 [compost metagenome]
MGGLGDELRLALEQAAQTGVELVEGVHQRPQLARQVGLRQRLQVVAGARRHRLAQLLQRAQRQTHRQPHQAQRGERQQAHAPQGADQQLAGHALAGATGLGHADLGNALQVRFADRLQQADHAHRLLAVDAIVEARQRRIVVGALDLRRRRRQRLVAGNQRAERIEHLVVDAPGAVVGEGVQRHVGHIGLELAVAAVQAVGHRARRGQQGAVVGGVGRAPRAPVAAQAAEQQDQCQQQGQPAQQTPAQAAAAQLSHRRPPAGSRDHGR